MIFFSCGKGLWFSPRMIPQKAFHIGQALIRKYGLKTPPCPSLSFAYACTLGNKPRVISGIEGKKYNSKTLKSDYLWIILMIDFVTTPDTDSSCEIRCNSTMNLSLETL